MEVFAVIYAPDDYTHDIVGYYQGEERARMAVESMDDSHDMRIERIEVL